jgi:hypothetical protein
VRTYDEIYNGARDGSPFSNSTEWEMWSDGWCNRPCRHDAAFQRDEALEGCPLILLAMVGKTPSEWLEQPPGSPDRYHCIEFRGEDEPGDTAPQPIPDPPGQETLLPRESCEGVRMLTVLPEHATAGAR